MSCRRVLSSTPLWVWGSETVWDSRERKLTNKKYKYYKLLKSSKKVVGPVSTQALVDWWLGEWGNDFIGVYTNANIIIRAESADFFFYWWYTEVMKIMSLKVWNGKIEESRVHEIAEVTGLAKGTIHEIVSALNFHKVSAHWDREMLT
jgi:hypothetical protein